MEKEKENKAEILISRKKINYQKKKPNFNFLFFFSDEFCSDLMEAAIDLRHTYLGAFNPTQNVTQKLKTSLEKVRFADT